MSAVTKQQIVEALRGPVGAIGNAKRKELADRIEQHGIAPPDGMVLVPKEHLQQGLEYVSSLPTILVMAGDKNPELTDEVSDWCYATQAALAAAPEVKP